MLIISAAQCRAARALIGMNQPDLAAAASLGLSTIVDFERGRRAVSAEAISAIRDALEAAGVVFIETDRRGPEKRGPGVRLALPD